MSRTLWLATDIMCAVQHGNVALVGVYVGIAHRVVRARDDVRAVHLSVFVVGVAVLWRSDVGVGQFAHVSSMLREAALTAVS